MIPPAKLFARSLFLYFNNEDHDLQGFIRSVAVTTPRSAIVQQLTFVLHEYSPYVQSFDSLRDLTEPVRFSNNFKAVIHVSEKRSLAFT